MDIFLIVMIVALSIMLIITSIYLLAYYCHPDDSAFGAGTLCKVFVVIGLALAWGQIMLLPLDVSNVRGTGGGLPMDMIYKIIYIAIAAFAFVILPLLTAIYESDPDDTCIKRIMGSFCFFIGSLVVVVIAFLVFFALCHTAKLPVKPVIAEVGGLSSSTSDINFEDPLYISQTTDRELNVDVSFPVFAIGFLCFISYFLFTLFGGIGLFALPMDMIYSFISRPKKLDKAVIESMKKEIVETAADLKELALKVKALEESGANKKMFFSPEKREYNELYNKLKVGVSCISDEYDLINLQNLITGKTILEAYISLIVGILCLIVSGVWVFQIVVYVVLKTQGKALYQGLNVLLVYMTDKGISFVAIGIFAIMCMYLLLCTMKGNLKFGVRFFILGSIHPMKKNETYMNSILFNISLIMIASVSVNQFCLKAFNEYAAMTDFDLIFSQVKYLAFFVFFEKYHIFEYALCALIVLTLVYLIIVPSDSKNMKKVLYQTQAEQANKPEKPKDETMIEMTEK
ncbi:MAG: LMBR1 domain-containing protein [archaeon]|nr:LMBR1 domain-containing protein [archaeon]